MALLDDIEPQQPRGHADHTHALLVDDVDTWGRIRVRTPVEGCPACRPAAESSGD